MPEAEKKKAIAEFSFTKGILVATFSGIMSAGFSFGMTAGEPITVLTLRSDYINAAKANGIEVKDAAPLDANAASELAKELKGTAFFQTAPKNVQNDPSFGNVLEVVEEPFVLELELNGLKDALPSLKGEALSEVQKQLENKQRELTETKTASSEQARLLAGAAGSVAPRVIAYSQQIRKLAGKTKELGIIRGLKDLTVKEVAVATAVAGGNLPAYHQKHQLWQGLPRLIVILFGGFTVNFLWCVLLNIKNRTGYQYLASHVKEEHAHHGGVGGSEHGGAATTADKAADLRIPALANYLLSALAGTCWYFQFFFYSMGETQMGKFSFASWTLHMASIIIFSTMWGWIFHEWRGSSKKTHLLITGGIGTLILSTIVIGFGTWLKGQVSGGH